MRKLSNDNKDVSQKPRKLYQPLHHKKIKFT